MEVKFYKGFVKKESSTLQPVSSSITIECYMKRETSILTPTLVLDVDYKQTYFDYNYFKMDNRYYWVTDVVLGNNNIIEISGKVDVLASWKQYIGNTQTYITRSSLLYDGNINDEAYPMKNSVRWNKVEANPAKIFQYNTLSDGVFVMSINNSQNASAVGTTSHYLLTKEQMDLFCKKLLRYDSTSSAFDWIGNITEDMSENLFKALFNPLQYVSSCRWLPISINSITSKEFYSGAIGFGNWGIDLGTTGFYVPTTPVLYLTETYTVPKNTTEARYKYLNDSPYTEYYLDILPFGTVAVDPVLVRDNNTLNVEYCIDLFTGECTATVYGYHTKSSGGGEFFANTIITTKLGVDVELTQITRDSLGEVAALSGFQLSINPAATASSFGQSLIGYTRAKYPLTNTIGSSGGSFAGLNRTHYLVAKFTDVVEKDPQLIGYPLCQIKKISDIPGYVQCLESDDLLAPATEPELAEIREHMTSGFFYE